MITPAGQAFFQVLGIFAELERSIAMAARLKPKIYQAAASLRPIATQTRFG